MIKKVWNKPELKKVWNKPALLTMSAGAAEKSSAQNRVDGTNSQKS